MWQDQGDDNIYEGEIGYSNNQVRIPDSSCRPPLPGRSGELMSPRKTVVNDPTNGRNFEKPAENQTKKCIFFVASSLVLIGILVIGSLVMAGVVLSQMAGITGPVNAHSTNGSIAKPNVQQPAAAAKSCWDLKKTGTSESGIHEIENGEHDHKIEVFCDMETDGGGWTLVASIHENDITEKCDVKDRWATHVSPGYIGTVVQTNWENKLTFGRARECTADDYKSAAYYEINARDVMVWHVPSGTSISTVKGSSTLRYRTTNQFLVNGGGNLHALFNYRYPLTTIKQQDLVIPTARTRRVLDALFARRDTLKSKIPNWQEYTYTGVARETSINDGSLYSSSAGNMLHFYTSRQGYGYLEYEKEYQFLQPTFFLGSKRSQPFIMLTAISNEDSLSSIFRTRSRSYLKSSSYTDELMENNITFHNFELQYRAVQYYYPSYPEICEFHFIAFNRKEWGSTPPTWFNRTSQYNSATSERYYSYFEARGSPSNFVMGYLLLARTAGNKFTTTHTDAIADVILKAVVPFTDLFNEEIRSDGLSVPVTFDKGSVSTVLSMVPPIYRHFVQPGYIQFRAYNLTGFPNAFCPGLKMKSFHPEYMCIGGISEDIKAKYGTCGDFAGWGGKEGDTIDLSISSGHAHSHSDISSTILIFYR